MAPIGIVTIMVSAIRVGGYGWLKAVIGRARENIAAAELEVMSSTSREVCELWNGRTVVRCPGAADISELICIYPTEGAIKSVTIMNIRHATLSESEPPSCDSASFTSHRYFLRTRTKPLDQFTSRLSTWLHGHDEESEPHLDGNAQTVSSGATLRRNRSAQNAAQAKDMKRQRTRKLENSSKILSLYEPEEEMIIVRNSENFAPNISLNRQRDSRRWHLWALAAVGVVIQGGVLVYFGFVTEYHSLRFEKDGQPVDEYAMPLAVSASLLLVTGMLICAHVVDSASTEEFRELDTAKKTTAVAMVWLQKETKVSDQYFQSAAIYPEMRRSHICASKRAIDDDENNPFSHDDSESDEKSKGGPGERLKVLTATGTFITVLGIGGQFTGLRGMHWTASIAQLGAVVLMTILRALARRQLTQSIKQQKLSPGFELDWFVQTLANPEAAPWLPPRSMHDNLLGRHYSVAMSSGRDSCSFVPAEGKEQEPQRPFWAIQTGCTTVMAPVCGPTRNPDRHSHGVIETCCKRIFDLNTVKSIFDLRRSLGELYRWKSPVVAEAITLSRAIEVTMEVFAPFLKIGPSHSGSYIWSITVRTMSSGETLQKLDFHMEKKPQGWSARADELDAALSLWLYSSEAKQETTATTEYPSGDDRWIRGAEVQDRCLRILGPSHGGLVQDMEWWMPNSLDSIKVAEIQKTAKPEEEWTADKHPFKIRDARIGRSGQNWSRFDSDAEKTSFIRNQNDLDVQDWTCKILEGSDEKAFYLSTIVPVFSLVMDSQKPLKELYAMELFASFVWALGGCLKPSSIGKEMKAAFTPGIAAVSPGIARDPKAWRHFALSSEELSQLVQSIVTLGFCTEREAYSSLIPPLSHSDNLPGVNCVTDLALSGAVPEKNYNWSESARVYQGLYEIAQMFSPKSYIYCKSMAVLMRFEARTQRRHVRCFGSQRDEVYESRQLLRARQGTNEMLKSAHTKDSSLLERLQRIFNVHEHMNSYAFSLWASLSPNSRDSVTWLLESKYANESSECPIYNSSVPQEDIFHRTGLHHAAKCSYEGCDMLARYLDSFKSPTSRRDRDLRSRIDREKLEQKKTIQDICVFGDNSTNWPDNCSSALLDPCGQFAGAVRNGADFNARDLDHWTPLHHVCDQLGPHFRTSLGESSDHENHLKWFRESLAEWRATKLISQGANVNAQGLDGLTPLHCAVKSGCLGLINLLIDGKADLLIANVDGHTPLHLAAMMSKPEVISKLIGPESDIELRDLAGRTPLHLAVMHNDRQSIRHLIRRKAKTDARDFKERSLVHLASLYDNSDAMEVLLGGDPAAGHLHTNDANCKDSHGRTPLHLAALFNSTDAVGRLLGLADAASVEYLDARDITGKTPLHLAALSNASEAIHVLMSAYGALPRDSNISWPPMDSFGETPFHLAASEGSVDAIQVIIDGIKGPGLEREAISDILQLRAGNDSTAFAQAIDSGKTSTVQAFLEIRVDGLRKRLLTERVSRDATPLVYAVERGSEGAALCLIEQGADFKAELPSWRESLLHMAIRKNMRRVAEALFDRTRDWQGLMSVLDGEGYSPEAVAKEVGGEAGKWFDELQKRAEESVVGARVEDE